MGWVIECSAGDRVLRNTGPECSACLPLSMEMCGLPARSPDRVLKCSETCGKGVGMCVDKKVVVLFSLHSTFNSF